MIEACVGGRRRVSWHSLLLAVFLAAPALARPPEPAPPLGDLQERARTVVAAVRKNDPSLANPFFYPREEFAAVKAIKDPLKYFDYLLAVYHKDIRSIREKLTAPEKVEFVRLEVSRGRNFIERGKEANKAPYYAIYRSRLVLRDEGVERVFTIRVLISWKGQWFVTHALRKTMNEKF